MAAVLPVRPRDVSLIPSDVRGATPAEVGNLPRMASLFGPMRLAYGEQPFVMNATRPVADDAGKGFGVHEENAFVPGEAKLTVKCS